MQRAATATQRKRHEVVSAFRLMGDAIKVQAGRADDPTKVALSGTATEQAIRVVEDPQKNLCRDVTAERIRRLNASTDPNHDELVAGFAYLRTERIPIENLDLTMTPATAWTSLEPLHGLRLTPYDPDLPWDSHETTELTLVLVDRYEPALLDWLQTRWSPTHVYTWAKGRFQKHLAGPGIQLSQVVETLVSAHNPPGADAFDDSHRDAFVH